MKIYNIDEHLSCYCYSKNEKPQIEVSTINHSESEEISLLLNEIVMVLKGSVRYTMHNNLNVNVGNGNMIFLPANSKIHYKAAAGSMVLILRIKDEVQLCHTYNLNRLKNNIDKIDKPLKYETMEINARLKYFAKRLVETCADGLKCSFFYKAKITEALIMLRAYYTEEELLRFFYYYFTPDAAFADFVRENYLNYSTVNEFANALNMTSQQFSRRFYIVFGEAPYGWMQREKAQLIYGEICRTNRSLKDIGDEYGFTIQANFNRFCKMAFGMNPREIRKQRKNT